jgi:hypothetical protein
MTQRAQQGIGWGPRAFGSEQTTERIVRAEARAVRDGYAAYLSGASILSIAQEWNRRGLSTTKGNPWDGSTVRHVLRSPRYAGLRSHNGIIVGKGAWKPIVDEDTYYEALAKFDANSFTTSRSHAVKHLLSGMLICGECGKKMYASGNPTHRRIYACKNPGCYKVARSAEPIDDVVRDIMIRRISMPDAVALLKRPGKDMRGLYEELKAKRGKLNQIALDYAEDILTRGQAKVATSKVETRIEEIEREIAASSGDGSTGFADIDSDDVAAWYDGLPLERKRRLIDLLLSVTAHSVGRGWRRTSPHMALDVEWRVDD